VRASLPGRRPAGGAFRTRSAAAARLLLSRRPWLSLTYLLSSSLVAFLFAGLLIELTGRAMDLANQVAGAPGVLMVLVAVLAVVLPLASILLSMVERWRLRLVDPGPAPSRHPRLAVRPLWRWLVARCSERATWWEAAYALLFSIALAPFDLTAAVALPALPGVLLALPFYDLLYPGSPLHTTGHSRIAGNLFVDSVQADIALGLGGLLLIVPTAFAVIGLARVRGMVARLFLVGPGDQALTDRLRTLSRSRSRMVDAFDAERRRIERDLHDGAQQRLIALMGTLGLAEIELAGGPASARDLVTRARHEARDTLAELRLLVQGIHPPVLTHRGLPGALDALADRLPIPVELDVRLASRPAAPIESAAYFVAAEALANVVKHSRAARAWISISDADGLLRLEIGDDGVGGADPDRGTGLVGLTDRMSVLEGRLVISSPAGGPTVVRAEVALG